MTDPRKYIRETRERRQQKGLQRELRDQRTPRPSYYQGQDGTTGKPIVRSLGGIAEPLDALGNVQAEIGQQGRVTAGAFDVGTRLQSDRERRQKDPVGRIKVLVKHTLPDGTTEFWVGGHIKKPIKIKSFPLGSSPTGRLDNIGRGKNDWIFAYRHWASDTETTIGVIYGNKSQPDWEITSSEAQYLYTTGNGYFNSLPRFVVPPYKESDTTETPGPGLGGWVCANRARAGTCTSYTLSGASSSEDITVFHRTGVPDDFDPLFLTATNNYTWREVERSYWQGTYEGGSEPSLPENFYLGIATPAQCGFAVGWVENTDAAAITRTTRTIDRNLDAPAYAWDAIFGTINQFPGRYILAWDEERISQPEVVYEYVIGYTVTGKVTNVGESVCRLVLDIQRGFTKTVPGFGSISGSASASQNCPQALAPGIQKNYQFSATSPNETGIGTFTSTSYTALQNAEGAYLFLEEEKFGNCQILEFGVDIYSGATTTHTYYQGIGNTERPITLPEEVKPEILQWRLKPIPDEQPKFSKIDEGVLPSILSGDRRWEVHLLEDTGSGTYEKVEEPEEEKVYRMNFDPDEAEVQQADWY